MDVGLSSVYYEGSLETKHAAGHELVVVASESPVYAFQDVRMQSLVHSESIGIYTASCLGRVKVAANRETLVISCWPLSLCGGKHCSPEAWPAYAVSRQTHPTARSDRRSRFAGG